MDLATAAPLLCAEITLYSPLRHRGAGPGQKVGIIGLGGLGHMGVKLAQAMGATTVLFTTSASKVDNGKRLRADEVVLSRDSAQIEQHTNSFDLIIDTVSANHDLAPYFALLKRDATMVQVGAPEHPMPIAVFSLLLKRASFSGSAIGGIAETQEMLDSCAAKGITADVEIIPMRRYGVPSGVIDVATGSVGSAAASGPEEPVATPLFAGEHAAESHDRAGYTEVEICRDVRNWPAPGTIRRWR